MSRQFKNGRCSCWKLVDEELLQENTELSQAYTFTGHVYLLIQTKTITKSRKKPKMVMASFCPFCGKELKKSQEIPKRP